MLRIRSSDFELCVRFVPTTKQSAAIIARHIKRFMWTLFSQPIFPAHKTVKLKSILFAFVGLTRKRKQTLKTIV